MSTKSKGGPPKRTHPVLRGRITRLLKAFGLEMKDIPESVPYLDDNALQLPKHLTSKQIRQIGFAACLYDRSGFSLGDIIAWEQNHPEPAIEWETFKEMVLETGLARRTMYNYLSLSNRFPADKRHPGLSRPHHDAVSSRKLPWSEKRKLLHAAFEEGWSDSELKIRARIRKHELAMPAATGDEAANRALIVRSQIRVVFEKNRLRATRILRAFAKPTLTVKEVAKLQREMVVLLREIGDAKELLSQSLVPLK